MSLAPGVRLGVYEIVGPIGAGGMGEVYRAHDARLGRDVAIKVLPAAFSGDAERLHRFEQEARAAAALNHPNILAVYDIGNHNNSPYIVSELLEGETLGERAHGVALPVRKAVDYAVQIAHGLAAAHEKGIVHRDLKPANIFITTDGRVKILDFGLAKLTEREPTVGGLPGPQDPAYVPTKLPDTLPGMVLGTVGYMSPEQVRGHTADHRADLFAFGAILYELLSGQRAFAGDTMADTMTAILKEDPPDLPIAARHIPPALARIVDRCLEKSPAARFQSAGDLGFALETLSSHSGTAEAIVGRGAARTKRERLAWSIAAVFGVAFAAALALAAFGYFGRAPSDIRTLRFPISPPDGWSLALATGPTGAATAPLAVSPDGTRIAFLLRNAEGRDRLWVRSLDTLFARELVGTDGAASPFWSPDSRFLGFFADGKLKKVDVSGGPPITLCNAAEFRGGTWSRDGVIVFATSTQSALQEVSASGGVPTAATALAAGERGHLRPSFLPDGRHFFYRAVDRGIYVTSLDSTDRTLLLTNPDSNNVSYTQGYLLFLRETTLMAEAFDMRRLALTGEPVPVAEQIQTLANPPTGVFSASDNGVLAYQTGTAAINPQPTWFDRTGKRIAALGDPAGYGDFALSPDAKRAAVSFLDPAQRARDIWIFDVARGLRTRFTFDPADDVSPIWSPDGSRVVFASRRKGHGDLYQKASSGAGDEDVLFADSLDKFPVSWSPDGHFIIYVAAGGTTRSDLWVLPLSGDRKPFPFLQTQFTEAQGQFSPDGRWIAYASSESGRPEVYVAPFPAPGGRWQISTAGGNWPRWRHDGKEIFYLAPDNKLMVATVNGQGAGFAVGAVGPLFDVRPSPVRYSYDVSPDGQQFLVNTVGNQAAPATPITVVVNWTAGLKK